MKSILLSESETERSSPAHLRRRKRKDLGIALIDLETEPRQRPGRVSRQGTGDTADLPVASTQSDC